MNPPDAYLRKLFGMDEILGYETPSGEVTSSPTDDAPKPAAPVSLMITNRQRALLRDIGFSEDDIYAMTPAEAHAHLGL
jgi:hypothetical protein